jgi:hypothetical protein
MIQSTKTQTCFERFEDCSCQPSTATSLGDYRLFEGKFSLYITVDLATPVPGYPLSQLYITVDLATPVPGYPLSQLYITVDLATQIETSSTTVWLTAFCVVAVLGDVKHGCCFYSTHRRTAANCGLIFGSDCKNFVFLWAVDWKVGGRKEYCCNWLYCTAAGHIALAKENCLKISKMVVVCWSYYMMAVFAVSSLCTAACNRSSLVYLY